MSADDWSDLFDIGDCWVWKRSVNSSGYGTVWDAGQGRLVHRVIYELLVGPVPEGLHIDHLCKNRLCANPDHMEPVSASENLRRGIGGLKLRRRYCRQGHDTWVVGRNSDRGCRACATARGVEWNRRNRHAAA